MAYFPDLSSYKYINECIRPNTFNIGWLSADYPFMKGESSIRFQQRLLEFCAFPICKTRGWHKCEFCSPEDEVPVKIEIGGKTILYLGSAEVRIVGDGRIYASPDLVYHYVTTHQYLPPMEFIDAVLKSPLPTSKEYQRLLWDLIK